MEVAGDGRGRRVGDRSTGCQVDANAGAGGDCAVVVDDKERGRAGMPVDGIGIAGVRDADACADHDGAGIEQVRG